jgi:vitamin B12 transporter
MSSVSSRLAAGLACVLAPAAAFAAPADRPAGDDLVVVTAARLPQPLDAALSSVTVIRRADIERAQARTLEELLAGVEGLAIAGGGGLGKVTSVFVRGAESDHTLWLVDGVRIGSVTTGTPALQDLPLDTIERIEIVRGPRSSLYGADAIGGVVQIFTRRGRDARPSLRVTGGSNGTLQASAAAGLGSERAWADLQATRLQTDGINACLGLPFPPGGGCFTSEPDDDAYRNTAVNLRAGLRLGEAVVAEAFVQRAEGSTEFDGSFTNAADIVNEVTGLRVTATLSSGWSTSLQAGRSRDEATSFLNGAQASVFDSRRDSATWQNEFDAGTAGRIVAGVDWLDDRAASSTRYVVDSRRNLAAFAQYATRLGRHDLEVAARLDDNEQFGSNATGSLGWGMGLAPGLRAYASVGNAFKAPTFNELYFPFFGNPALEPERAVSVEAGLKHTTTWGRWTLAAFASDVDDLIAFDSRTFLPANLTRAALRGVDGSLAWRGGPWTLEQSLTLLDARDRGTTSTRGNELARRPRVSGRTTLGWSGPAVGLAASVQFAGRRYDDLANARRLGSYAVVDLTGSWRASSTLELQLRVANLADRRYETAWLYPALGREILFSVRYRAPGEAR